MELAFTGGFAWAAWQVLGKLQRHVAKIEKNIDDGRLLSEWDRECKVQAAAKQRSSASMGQGATASGHDHIFEQWRGRKLRPAQVTELASDLAELAQWAGAGRWVPELRGDAPPKPWAEYGSAGKVHLLQAADTLDFNFAEVVKRQAEDLAGNWLWQVTEALPALSAEPVRSVGPTEQLGDLKTRLTEAEAAVRSAFDSERRSQAAGLKGLVKPLAVAACVRKIQMLKVLVEEAGLTSAASAAAAERLRCELRAPISLTPADPAVAEQKAAAAAAVEAEAGAAVEAERATRMAQIETAAAATYRRVLTLQASSPTHWHTSSSSPALHRLGLLAALLAEMSCCDAAGTPAGAAAAAELADSIRKLTPQMRIKLSDEDKARQSELLQALTPAKQAEPEAEEPTPAEAEPTPAEAEPTPAEAEPTPAAEQPEAEAEVEAAAAGEEAEAEAAEAPAEVEAEAEAPAPPSPGVAAAELRGLLERAIRTQLAEAREERRAARVAAREDAAILAAAAKEAAEATAAAAEAAEAEEEQVAKAEDEPVAEAEGEKAEAEEAAEGEKAEEEAAAAAEPAAEKAEEEAATEEAKAEEEEAKEEEAKAEEAKAEEEKAEEAKEEEEEAPTAEESVDVEAVRKGVEEEARARADAEKDSAVMKLEDALKALHASTAAQALSALAAKVTAAAADGADGADGAPDAGARLLALESLLRNAAAVAPTDAALAAAAADAAAKLTAADRAALDVASAAAVGRVEAAAARIKLTADVAKLEMGPGCAEVLRRTDAWLAEQLAAVTAAAARAAERAARAEAKAAAAAAAAAAKAAKAEAEGEVAKAEAEGEEEEKAEEAKAAEEEVGAEEAAKEAPDEEEEEVAPVGNPARLEEGRRLVSELLQEGLVLLELPPQSNKKLQLLRESVDALDPVDGDGAVQNRLITTLKEVVGQLGPIGGSVDARVSQVSDEAERERLLKVRSDATSIYLALTAFLRLETEIWEAAKSDLDKAKKAVYGVKIERRAESLAAGMEACGLVSERCASLASAVLGLGSAEGKQAAAPAKAALQATAEQAQTLSSGINDYLSYVRLREHALGVPLTSKAELDEDCELSLPTLDEMRARHGEEAVWLDLAGLGLPQVPGEEDEEEEEAEEGEVVDEAAAAAKREAVEAQERAVEELQQRLNDWHGTGLRLLSRGQAALVTLGGLTVDGSVPSASGSGTSGGDLRLTADLGLPSAKSLVQLGAEKLARLQLLAAESVGGPNSGVAHPLQWYLLVPPSSVAPLKAFLEDNNYFGLLASQVHVYGNEVRPPLLNEDFKVVLDSSGVRTARSQPGSGDVFLALRRCGALSHMRRCGIRCLEVCAVEDNLLGRPLDPAFVGACAATAIDSAAKVAVPGVQTEGPSALPELYSRYLELLGGSSPLLPTLGDAVPALGSYYLSMDFVRRVEKLLREQPLALYRLAPADKVPTRGSAAAAAAPAAKPGAAAAAAAPPPQPAPGGGSAGYRFERRLSDFASPAIQQLLGASVHLAMVAVDAGTEFSPVWGSAPFYRTASAKAAVDALLLQHTSWVEDSGGAVADEEGVVEVSPLVSYAGEGLTHLVESKTFEEAYVRELQGFSAKSTTTGSATNVGAWAVPALVLYGGVVATKLLTSK
ncbi:hypothetical protein PLESTB_001520400 [Pleodorina starrii]|uniref:Uncharacterized protein n=1 Tax=Pleodorina starrii TaxID=330485 RepID=A0A9W6F7Z0_9CHLO|nr:hypothetical protein PLESTB_001520400 [Pleodorina starrii]